MWFIVEKSWRINDYGSLLLICRNSDFCFFFSFRDCDLAANILTVLVGFSRNLVIFFKCWHLLRFLTSSMFSENSTESSNQHQRIRFASCRYFSKVSPADWDQKNYRGNEVFCTRLYGSFLAQLIEVVRLNIVPVYLTTSEFSTIQLLRVLGASERRASSERCQGIRCSLLEISNPLRSLPRFRSSAFRSIVLYCLSAFSSSFRTYF